MSLPEGKITLECPRCRTYKNTDRAEGDPASAVIIYLQCPECNGGDFDSPRYFDINHQEVQWDDH